MAFATSTYIALNNVPISIAGSGLIQAFSTLNPAGTGFNVTSATETQATGPATATAQNQAQVGLLFGDAGTSPVSIGGALGIIQAAQYANTTASATASDANATAQATNGAGLSGNTNGGPFVGSGPIGGGIIYLGNNGTTAGANTPGQLAIGGQGQIGSFVNNGVAATATTTSGNAVANADPGNAYGIYDTSIKVGGIAGQANLVNVQLDGSTTASATSTTGNATARAGLDDFARNQYAGILHSGYVGSSANSGGLEPLVLSFGAGNTTISSEVGVPATPGAALVQIGADANTVTGNANARAQADLLGGIYQNGVATGGAAPLSASGLQIQIGQVGTVIGKAQGETNATARTINGVADAYAGVDETVGIGDEGVLRGFVNPVVGAGSAIKIGQDGNIAAGGAIESNATASSVTTGGGPVTATTDNNFAIGLALGGINLAGGGTGPGVTIGGNGSFTLYADNTQNANASATTTNAADPAATAGFRDQTFGALGTNIVVGQNLNVFQTTAQLDVDATASAINGIATASSGNQSNTAALKDSSLTVGLNADNTYVPPLAPPNQYSTAFNPGPIAAFSQSEITSSATVTGVTGDAATATSGGGSSSIGIDNSPIKVGLNGRVDAGDLSVLNATASSNSGAATALVGNESLVSNQYYLSSGIYNSDITIGTGSLTPGAGKIASGVTGQSGVSATASATSNGLDPAVPGPGDNANAGVQLFSTGISLGVNPNLFGNQNGVNPPDSSPVNNIKIGLEGNVSGNSQVVGSSTASSNAGNANAAADLLGAGIDLEGRSTILIGSKGNITGTALLGTFGQATTPYAVTSNATGTGAVADAGLAIGLAGIDGNGGGTTQLTAGSNTGSVFGTAYGAGNTAATSANGNATANTGGLGLVGISDANVTAGLVTNSNLVGADVFGDFRTTATANNGNAVANSSLDAFGLSGTDNKITVNGGVQATAFLNNIVTANSTNGSAVANANSTVVGIDGYTINVIGGGSVLAQAGGITSATVIN